MKKREQVKRKDNVIFFPGIEKRLAEKGLESLRSKRFTEAIKFLEEAKELDPDHDDILIGLVLAYFEAGAFQKAKILAKELLRKGIGDYFQMVDLYITVLIQLHEYEEIVSTIEALLEEKEIPADKHDHFLTLLQFSRKMAENGSAAKNDDPPEEDYYPELNLFSIDSLNEQLLTVSRLAEKNIRPYLGEIEKYLKTESGHPFLKTILLTILKEQDIDRSIIIRKFSREMLVNPSELPEVREQPRMKEIQAILEERLENENPVLFENINNMVERTFFISYPFTMKPDSINAWAAAFEMLAQEYFGMELEINEWAEDYKVLPEEIEQAIQQIEELEKISFPNL